MMLHSFLANELAREKVREVAHKAAHAADLARATAAKPSGLRATIGLRLVRVGLRLSGGEVTSLHAPARVDPTCL